MREVPTIAPLRGTRQARPLRDRDEARRAPARPKDLPPSDHEPDSTDQIDIFV